MRPETAPCVVCGKTPTKRYGISFDGKASDLQVPLCQFHADEYCWRAGVLLGEMARKAGAP